MNRCPHCDIALTEEEAVGRNCPVCGRLLGGEPLPDDSRAHTNKPGGLLGLLAFWFGLSQDVGPRKYAITGFSLMAVKYAVEAAAIFHFTGKLFRPVDFLNPLLSSRMEFLNAAPDWLGWAFFVWTLPFLWISVSMSVRRSVETAGTAWLGLLVLIPGINYIAMLMFCLLPSQEHVPHLEVHRRGVKVDHGMRSALYGIGLSVLLSLGVLGISVYAMEDYGATLFLATPILVGAVSAFLYNRPYPRSFGSSMVVSQTAILICGAVILLFALEGVICLVMLMPIACGMGLLGGMIGYVAGVMTPDRAMLVLPLGFLPIFAGVDHGLRTTPEYEVVSVVEIDAPPEKVWPNVVGFSELPAPPSWYFKLGIAYPQRATITGTGVGAVRRCEFSTGAFVEPITVWDEPNRLAFDVQSQPPPMHELSPYQHVHPPHLDGYLRCQRGEFRLIRLPGNRTRLEGSTWYEFDMYPQHYWTLWSNTCIHRIHERVLTHIKRLSEAP